MFIEKITKLTFNIYINKNKTNKNHSILKIPIIKIKYKKTHKK